MCPDLIQRYQGKYHKTYQEVHAYQVMPFTGKIILCMPSGKFLSLICYEKKSISLIGRSSWDVVIEVFLYREKYYRLKCRRC